MAEFAYKESLEKARKAVLDQRSKFAVPEATEQRQIQAEGLMRPRARSQDQGATQSPAPSFGLAFMDTLMPEPGAPTSSALSESPYPEARPVEEKEEEGEGPRRPDYRPGTISESDLSDREILALTLQAEAGGEGYEGMLAVGSVIKNRADAGGYGKGIRGVIMKPAQFSAWNSVTGYAGGEGGLDMDKIRPSKTALEAADRILSGSYKDPTGGATHYYNPSVATPKWGPKNTKDWRTIGGHIFGRA